MGEKDIEEKILMSYADVFTDCVNALAYGGRERLKAEELQPAPTESFYHGKGKTHNQFCDRSFYRMEKGERKVQYIVENETCLKRKQVLRKASYQGGPPGTENPPRGGPVQDDGGNHGRWQIYGADRRTSGKRAERGGNTDV